MRRPQEAHLRHILVSVEPGADDAAQKAARAKIDRVLAEARAGADFAALARVHSDDPSGPQGDDLGFVERQQLVAPFADAAFALQPGQLSDVVRTQFGFHLIKLEERRGGDLVSQAEAAAQIREYLLPGKIQQAVQERVARLRAEAAVEIAELR
jgi:peptidyl-prolyl cis-trans isomerase C